MITYREINYEQDIEEIVKLLNANFETLHTKEAFLWKHYYNPFGKSYGLLAVENEKIAGLRMFMRWEFLCEGKTIKAIRPVDTCTDHQYRGRGLFKKITLQGLKNIKKEYELIFNTPNQNSKPGYLKMGWKEVNTDIQYQLGVINFLKSSEDFENVSSHQIAFKESWVDPKSCQTHLSQDYLAWRYQDPAYRIAKFKDGGVVIYKLSKLKNISTLILIDSFGSHQGHHRRIRSVCKKNKVKALYYLRNKKNSNLKLLFSIGRGDQTVVWKDDEHGIHDEIMFSVGDLEGRL